MKRIFDGLTGKNKPILMFGLALSIALLISILTYNWMKSLSSEKAQNRETVSIVVAAADLPWGKSLTADLIKVAPYLKESVPPGYFSDLSVVAGRTLIYPVRANEPIIDSKLAPTTVTAGGVAAVVSPKKRAMGVKVDKVVGISGFIHPGHRVDVLVTLDRNERSNSPTTKIVLENILVLATGSEVEQTGAREKPSQVDVITLEVTPEEGEKLALAATEGKLQLALRNFADTESSNTRGTTISMLLSNTPGNETVKAKPVKAAPRRPAPEQPQSYTVELIKGSKVSETNFKKGE
jgi:pilus assembly protein CpaB